MEELLQLDHELTQIKKIMEDLFSFKKEPNFEFLNTNCPLRIDIKKIFLEKLDYYVKIHLISELKKQINKTPKNKESELKLFLFIKSGLVKLYNHFIKFLETVDKKKNLNLTFQIKPLITRKIVYDVIEELKINDYYKLYFENLLFYYKEICLENLSKKKDGQSKQDIFKINCLDNYLGIKKLSERPFSKTRTKFYLDFLNNLYDYKNFFLSEQYNFLNNKIKEFIDSILKNENHLKSGRVNIQHLLEDFHRLYVKNYLLWIFSIMEIPRKKGGEEMCKILKENMIKLFLRSISSHVFSFLLNYQNFKPILENLSTSLKKNNYLEDLTSTLNKEINTKLLKPSITTIEIIKFYINLLKFWSNIQTNYQLLNSLTTSVKKYFLSRENALRCIISLWLREIKNNKILLNSEENMINVPINDEREFFSDEDFVSEENQIEFMILKSKKTDKFKFKKSNIKTLLIDLYGSREIFITEYEHFLAEKILYFKNINKIDELKTLDFLMNYLKNSSKFTRCDVLKSDLEFSDKITDSFQKRNMRTNKFYKFLIVSKSFWPINYDLDNFELPKIDRYKWYKDFEKFFMSSENNKKKIELHYNIGKVELEIELNKKNILAICTPLNALLLFMVNDYEDGVSLKKMSETFKLDENFIKNKMVFWVSNQIIVEKKSDFTLNLEASTNLNDIINKNTDENLETKFFVNNNYNLNEEIIENSEEINEWILSSQEITKVGGQNEVEKSKLENLIISILKSSGAKTSQKIFELLQTIYVKEIPSVFNKNITHKLMEKMVKAKKIHSQGEIYYV